MGHLLHASLSGSVERIGPRRLDCRCEGRLVTALLGLLLVVWAAGALAMLVGAVLDREPGAALGAVVGLPACAGVAALIRLRVRRMGRFEVDAEAGTLTHRRGRAEVGRWPLAGIRFARVWDPFHRGGGLGWWLVARAPDGRGLRLAKGSAAEIDGLLGLLAGWGCDAGRAPPARDRG